MLAEEILHSQMRGLVESCRKNEDATAVVDDVDAGFGGGHTDVLLFGSGWDPDVFHSGRDQPLRRLGVRSPVA